ncbi:uncharacterized protein LOC131655094 [Vicia villosa]|uniref:uncharacterized protein LOC131655094 n=1 Tax=Vicia villosa TaxID=3911 RepID=UPI00273A81F7|nr:uncharacterized protein LOC131655094 [Vicia villosa]
MPPRLDKGKGVADDSGKKKHQRPRLVTGGSSFPPPTQTGPSSFQQTRGSSFPPPTQTGPTPHPPHVPPQDDDQAEDETAEDETADDQLDGSDLRGDDDPSQIHIIDGRFFIRPEGSSFTPSRTAAKVISYIIQQNYKKLIKTFKDVKGDDRDHWFAKFQEKCVWEPMKERQIKKNYYGRTARRLSDMLRRVRKRWELHGIRPSWIGEEIFRELLKYWESDEFAAKSENAKKMRASEKGGCLNAVGSISTAEHVRRMTKELNRPPLMTELVARTRKKKTGAFVDSRTQKAMYDYQALLVQFLTANPKYTPRPGEPLHPDWRIMVDDSVKNGGEASGDGIGGCHIVPSSW